MPSCAGCGGCSGAWVRPEPVAIPPVGARLESPPAEVGVGSPPDEEAAVGPPDEDAGSVEILSSPGDVTFIFGVIIL